MIVWGNGTRVENDLLWISEIQASFGNGVFEIKLFQKLLLFNELNIPTLTIVRTLELPTYQIENFNILITETAKQL